MPRIPGAKEHCLSIDDFFWLKEDPGKTLVVGNTSSAVECAGILTNLGYQTQFIYSGELMKGIDRQMTDKILQDFKLLKMKFMENTELKEVEKENGMLNAVQINLETGEQTTEAFKTVIVVGDREPNSGDLCLDHIGV